MRTTEGQGVMRLTAPDGTAYETSLAWRAVGRGMPELMSFSIRREDGGAVPTSVLQGVAAKVDDLLDRAHAEAMAHHVERIPLPEGVLTLDGTRLPVADGELVAKLFHTDPEAAGARILEDLQAQRRRRKITPEFLEEVARVYRANPDAPTKAVREWRESLYGSCSSAQASRYVAEARRRGILEPREA